MVYCAARAYFELLEFMVEKIKISLVFRGLCKIIQIDNVEIGRATIEMICVRINGTERAAESICKQASDSILKFKLQFVLGQICEGFSVIPCCSLQL